MEKSKIDFMEITPHLKEAAEKAAKELVTSGENLIILEDCDGMVLVRHDSPEYKEREGTKGQLLFPLQLEEKTFFVSLS